MTYHPPASAPFLRLSHSEQVDSGFAFPVFLQPTLTEGEFRPTQPPAEPTIHVFSLPANSTIVEVVKPKPYRQNFKMLSPHDCGQVEFSFDRLFRLGDYGRISDVGIIIPVFPWQRLYARQPSEEDLEISVLIEPRGKGR